VEVLKQGQFDPVPVSEQIVVIYAVTNGHMDKVAVDDVRRFEKGLREHVANRYGDILDHLEETGEISDEERLKEAIASFAETFEAKSE